MGHAGAPEMLNILLVLYQLHLKKNSTFELQAMWNIKAIMRVRHKKTVLLKRQISQQDLNFFVRFAPHTLLL